MNAPLTRRAAIQHARWLAIGAVDLPSPPADRSMIVVPTVAGLVAVPTWQLGPETLATAIGYHEPGDGGGGTYRWDPQSALVHNDGTVLAPRGVGDLGRWLAMHDGEIDIRRFGIVDDGQPADDALDHVVNDPSVHDVRVRTRLLLERRHTFTRSHVVIDFGGNLVTAARVPPTNDPSAAVLCFRGSVDESEARPHVLRTAVPDGGDVIDVETTAPYQLGQWWIVRNQLASWDDAEPGFLQRDLDRLVQITEVVGDHAVRVGTRVGWPIAAGRTLTWIPATPVRDVTIRNLEFTVEPAPSRPEGQGVGALAFEVAVGCVVERVAASRTYWSLVYRHYNDGFRTSECDLTNPVAVDEGGAGYLADHRNCTAGVVETCHASNSRHLVNFTASAFCSVRGCFADGDDRGAFVTHGQYEHDIEISASTGLVVLAGSGAPWGGFAKRMTVREHRCSELVARTRVVDLTLDNVHAFGGGTNGNPGWIRVNADGLQMRGCVAEAGLSLFGSSHLSARPTVVAATSAVLTDPAVPVIAPEVVGDIHFDDVVLVAVDGHSLSGSGGLALTRCTIRGRDESAAPLTIRHRHITLDGGVVENSGVQLVGPTRQELVAIGGVEFSGGNGLRATLSRREDAGASAWTVASCSFSTDDPEHHHLIVDGGSDSARIVGAMFRGGRLFVDRTLADRNQFGWAACLLAECAADIP
jgi:hypothetical protein